MTLNDRVKNNINVTMEKQGVARSELARRLGVSRQRVTDLLDNHKAMRLDLLERIATALDIQPWRLLK